MQINVIWVYKIHRKNVRKLDKNILKWLIQKVILWNPDHLNKRVIMASVVYFQGYGICTYIFWKCRVKIYLDLQNFFKKWTNSKTLIVSLILPVFGDLYTRALFIESFMMMIMIKMMMIMMICFVEIIWQKYSKLYLHTDGIIARGIWTSAENKFWLHWIRVVQ